MEFTHSALVQLGHVVFGVGSTEQEAREDAAEWLEADEEYTGEKIVDAVPCYVRGNHAEGDLVVICCTAALVESVLAHGGNLVWETLPGGICLPSELEEDTP